MTGHFLILVWDLCTRKLVSTSFLKVGVAYWMQEYSFVLSDCSCSSIHFQRLGSTDFPLPSANTIADLNYAEFCDRY